MATTLGVFATFHVLLSAVPVDAAREAQSASTAGYLTACLMGSAVAGQLATTWLLARFDAGRVTACGAVLCAVSGLLGAMTGLDTSIAFLGQCARGFGFGIVSVASAAILVADVVPESRRRGLARLTLVTGIPGVVMAPLGLMILERFSIHTVFGVGAALSAVSSLCILAMPRVGPTTPTTRPGEASRLPAVVWIYAAGFIGVSAAWMIFVTYMPLAHGMRGSTFIAGCLLFASAVRALARWLSAHGEMFRVGRTLVGSVAVGLGGSLLVLVLSRPSLIIGALLLGVGLGLFHSSVYLGMLESVSAAGLRAVGVVWNACIDVGGLIGAFVAGSVTLGGDPRLGLAIAPCFLAVAGVVVVWLALMKRESRLSGPGIRRP